MKLSLNEKQRWAFYSPATEVLYGGAAGGGKSFLLRISAIRWCEQVPGIQVYLFRRTFPDLRDNHLRGPTSFHAILGPQIDSGFIKYNKQDNEFVWVRTGSRIKLCHCQHEDDVQNYQGAEIHVLMMDELTHFTEYQYRFLRGRVRCIGLQIPEQYKEFIPRIECGTNPGSIGHQWVKTAFIRSPFEIYQTAPEEGGMRRQYIPAKLSDNPDLQRDDPTYEQRLDGLGSPSLVRAMKEGDWDIFAGQFFELWRRDVHVLPAKDFKIEPWWNKFGAYDHGFNHPFAFGAYTVDGDGNIYKYREVGGRGLEAHQIEDKILSVCPEAAQFTIWAGHDLWSRQRDGGPQTVEKFKKLRMVKANIDRKQGAAHLRQYLFHQNENGMVVRPRFYVLDCCEHTIRQIPLMVYDERDPEDVLKVDATDKDPWAGDDFYDETRYGLMSRPQISHVPEKPVPMNSIEWYKYRNNLKYKKRNLQFHRLLSRGN